jgi:hypothetical protein
MFARHFHPSRFLLDVYGTEPFREYCRTRHIPFDQSAPEVDADRWRSAISTLTPDTQARIELELAQVNELAGSDANAHLVEVGQSTSVPPVDIPGGAILALWFFVHHPDLFQDVFFHHEVRDVQAWRLAKAEVDLDIGDLPQKATGLGEELRAFFRQEAGLGRFCAVEAHLLPDAICFAARVADRIQLVEVFSERGVPTLQRLRPALTVLFTYSRHDGRVLLKSHLRSIDHVTKLFQCFGQAVLNRPVTCDGTPFNLDKLKQPFHPLPDAENMAVARLRMLHLRYPERLGRRCIKLETLASDAPTAIDELLSRHVPGDVARDLTVTFAELQVGLYFRGRRKNYLIRLWPDRCSLNQTALGERLRACLQRWGLYDA